MKTRDEPTNQDVVENVWSGTWGLYISVHVHSTDRRGNIQWVQFALQQGVGESTTQQHNQNAN